MRTFTLHEVWILVLAARWTIALSLAAFIGGGAVGFVLAIARISPFKALRYIVSGYIQFVQAIPGLMLLLLFYYGLNLFGIRIDAWTAAVLAFTLSTSAFLAEIWRGCLQAVPAGQWDASRSLALNFPKTLILVIIPQAARMALPPTVGYMVQVVKGTSLAALIGFTELAKAGAQINTITFEPVLVFGTVAGIYFLICWPLSLLSSHLERQLKVGHVNIQAM
ncbi:amino acid ABC transporter permease [Microvirga sp. WGZ8]|uniref:Amino acid ABC transporter permease n=1 Tax=Microvirga puerhi TaxID=2876078 RepID=A0ABS7VSD2_9HYPH|nr:amino acid ABC transporter permease [Microvirga puerhi]MBZ6078461.1 amino acid ABC transporter permease [Microvirga puerhi]